MNKINVKRFNECNYSDGKVIYLDIEFEVYTDINVTINGCRLVNGENGYYIAFPSYKGKDGKYYKHAYYPFTDKEVESIVKFVEDNKGRR